MRPSSTINRPAQTTPLQTLHPMLQEALGSLDVQLEEELIRYRRQRALGKSGYTPRPASSKSATKALQSAPIAPKLASITAQAPGTKVDSDARSAATTVDLALTKTPETKSYQELKELARRYAAQIDQKADLESDQLNGAEDYLESSEELLRSLAQEEASLKAEQGFLRSLSTPLGLGAMLLLLLSSAMFGFVLMNPSSLTQWFNRKDQQVATRSANPTQLPAPEVDAASGVAQPNLANQEFPDLDLSTLGSVSVEGFTPPSGSASKPANTKGKAAQKANLGASGVSKSASGISQTPTYSVTAPALGPSGSQSEPEPAPPAGDVPSPRRLAPAPDYNPAPPRSYSAPSAPVRAYTPPARSSGAPAKPSQSRSSPKPSTKPKTPAKNSATAAPLPPIPPLKLTPEPVPTTSSSPEPVNNPSPNPSPSATASPMTSGANNGYKVVVPYTSDRALEQAREKVPDAYLQNYSDGAKVQMGAYDTEATAKQRADELRRQGVPAEVYKP